jgi:hypothetical protein
LTIKAGVFFFCKKILIRKQKSARRRPKVSWKWHVENESHVSRNEDGDKEFLGVWGAAWTRVSILLVEIKSTWYVVVSACFLLCCKRCHVCVDIGGPNWVIWRPKFPNHTSPTSRPDRHAPPTSIGAY